MTDENTNEENLQNVDLEMEDFYESQPGDEISPTTSHKVAPVRKKKAWYLILGGVILLIGGLLIAFVGKKEENNASSLRDGPPVAAPTRQGTSSPTHSSLYNNLKESPYVHRNDLDDPDSVAHSWISKNEWMGDKGPCHWHGVECEDHLVIGLNLTENGLRGTIPHEISILGGTLQSLMLTGNELTNSGRQLKWLGELTELSKWALAFIGDTGSQ